MRPNSREKFTVAIICALVLEAEAAEAHFDEIYDRLGRYYGKSKGDRNSYLNGRIGKLDVVLCYMPGMGKCSAAMVASDLRFSYSNIELALVVGICGGAPYSPPREPIFLGDAIISDRIITYDFGKQYPDGFKRKTDVKDVLGRPSHELMALLGGLSVDLNRKEFQDRMALHAQNVQQADGKWCRPAIDDRLYETSYVHKHHIKPDSLICDCSFNEMPDRACELAMSNDCASLGCDQKRISRRRDQENTSNANVHIGIIASADTVMKSGPHRDRLADTEGVIGYEMEGAGICDHFPCIVIKGVCDYADSHKGKEWQLYAAANGAAAAKTFLEYMNPVSRKERRGHWMVPFRKNPKFVGRQKEIEELKNLITNRDGPRELAVTGLGGVGKTQVALQVAYQIRDDDPGCSVFWIPCTSQESVEQAYTGIVQMLELSVKTDAKREVQRYLSGLSSGKWLLIYDNADNEDMWIKNGNPLQDFIPDNQFGRTLFTSRNRHLALDLTDSNVIQVREYDLNTGLQFLQRSLKQIDILEDHDQAILFLEKLMMLPLAITQAVAYVNRNQIKLSTYMELLEKQESETIEVLSEDFQDKWRYKDVQNPVATTWWVSFQQIRQANPLAAEFLAFMACVNPRNIPQCMLPMAKSANDRIKAIGLLKSYSFISDCEQAKHRLLSIHRLVHIATRNWMRSEDMIDGQIIETLNVLEKTLPKLPHPNCALIPETWRLYLPHVLNILKEESLQGAQVKHGRLIGAMCECLYHDRRYKEAEDLCTHSIQSMNTSNLNDEGFWRIVRTLTSICRLQCVSGEGRRVATQFLDLVRSKVSKDPMCIWLRAISYLNLQQDYEATKAFSEALKCLGPRNPATMELQGSTAIIYRRLKRHKEAEHAYLQVIQTTKAMLGSNHFITLRYQGALALLYRDAGKETQAKALYLRVIQANKRSIQQYSCHILDYQLNLALIYADQKRHQEAEEIMIQIIESKQREQGSKILDIMSHLITLFLLYEDWGALDKAEGTLMRLQVLYHECIEPCSFFDSNDLAHLRIGIQQMRLLNLRERLTSLETKMTDIGEQSLDVESKLPGMWEEYGDIEKEFLKCASMNSKNPDLQIDAAYKFYQ